ncbi:hypothetical protein BV25DRAFT_1921599 [Artomyces pyxidatus]|uniref:Uncharacterized protein n=1 Tax=Artomyces pyxidatus TaxID=48021 RepID=A0ACB8SHI9_9AGAM|nr:hypothetical protein BV25DRAFT_1921599 [Artomyces pyxidatus]
MDHGQDNQWPATPPPNFGLIGPGQPPVPIDIHGQAGGHGELGADVGGAIDDAMAGALVAFEHPPPPPPIFLEVAYDPLRRSYRRLAVEPSIHSTAFYQKEDYSTFPALHRIAFQYYTLCSVTFAYIVTSPHTAERFWTTRTLFDLNAPLYITVLAALETMANLKDDGQPGGLAFPRETHIFPKITSTMLRLVGEYFGEFRATITGTAYDNIVAPIAPPDDGPKFGIDLYRVYYRWDLHDGGAALPPVRDPASRQALARGLLADNNFLHSAPGANDYMNRHVITLLRLNFWMNSRPTPPDEEEILGMYMRMRRYSEANRTPVGTRPIIDWIPVHLYFATVTAVRQALLDVANGREHLSEPSGAHYRREHEDLERACQATWPALLRALVHIPQILAESFPGGYAARR